MLFTWKIDSTNLISMTEATITETNKPAVYVRLSPWAYDKLWELAEKENRKRGPQAASMLEAQLRDKDETREVA